MKLFRFVVRSFNDGVSCRFHQPFSVRTLSTYVPRDNRVENKEYLDSFESADEARMFNNAPVGNSQTDDFLAKLDKLGKSRDSYSSNFPGGSGSGGDNKEGFNSFESADEARIFSKAPVGNPKIDAFYAKLDMLGKRRDGYASNQSGGSGSGIRLDGLDDSFSTLSDGMDQKLKKASMYFGVDHDEVDREDYCYRPDIKFQMGGTYTVKDLDLTKPGVQKPPKRLEFEVTTKEVLQKADFRNVRFLANFITEAGVIIKRSKTKISAKAQRRVAREIKTARALGLMPFTTMGTKAFVFGQTMENLDQDFEYESFDNPTADDDDLGV